MILTHLQIAGKNTPVPAAGFPTHGCALEDRGNEAGKGHKDACGDTSKDEAPLPWGQFDSAQLVQRGEDQKKVRKYIG